MDTGIHLLNNRGQKVTGSTPIGSTRIFSSEPLMSVTEQNHLYQPKYMIVLICAYKLSYILYEPAV